jgi:hypothetical protein
MCLKGSNRWNPKKCDAAEPAQIGVLLHSRYLAFRYDSSSFGLQGW